MSITEAKERTLATIRQAKDELDPKNYAGYLEAIFVLLDVLHRAVKEYAK